MQRLVAPIVAGKMGRGFLLVFAKDSHTIRRTLIAARRGGLRAGMAKGYPQAQKRVQGNVLEQFLGGMINESERCCA